MSVCLNACRCLNIVDSADRIAFTILLLLRKQINLISFPILTILR